MTTVPDHSTCPDPAELAGFADGRLDPTTRARVAGHVSACDRCLADVGAIVRLERTEPARVPLHLKARASALRRPLARWHLAAAAAVVLLSAGTWLISERWPAIAPEPNGGEVVRSRPPSGRDPLLVTPAPDQRMPISAIAFEWRPVDQAIRYRVRVIRDDGQLVWEAETGTTRLEPESADAWPVGNPLYVTVTAVLPDARTARAPATRFTVAP